MISEQQCIDIMLDWFPDFGPQYQAHLDEWKGDPERPFGLDMAEFSRYAVDIIKGGSDEQVVKLTDFAELMITEGNKAVDYAICMMFLENITNKNGDRYFPMERFTTRLKPRSKQFCKELDESWGTTTKGI